MYSKKLIHFNSNSDFLKMHKEGMLKMHLNTLKIKFIFSIYWWILYENMLLYRVSL